MAKVLLVEDDNNLREIYEARLQAEGYDIVAASDGEEALAVAKNENPDLIISDVMMPKISGFEMLDILRNTTGLQNVKVIMLTALGQADDQQRANKLGADRYLVKSQVTLEDIVKAAQELLEGVDAPSVAGVAPVVVQSPADINAPAVASSPVFAPTDVNTLSASPIIAAPVAVQSTVALPTEAPVATPEPVIVPDLVVETLPIETNILSPEPALAEALNKALDEAEHTANSAAEEKADVTAQIETFIAQPTVVPQNVEPAPEPSLEAAAESALQPAPQPSEPVVPELQVSSSPDTATMPTQQFNPEESQAHDKIMEQAMDSLNTSNENTPVSAMPILHPNSPTPELDSAVRNAAQPSGKRIIAPLSNYDSKPNLSTLLAAEEAKEALANVAASPFVPPTPLPQPTDPALQLEPNGGSRYDVTPPAVAPVAVEPDQIPVPQPMQVIMPQPIAAQQPPAPVLSTPTSPVAPTTPNQPQSSIDPSSIAL
ncbi:response regulator [Candidatus Saccharibacteria bacterium]|nr:response regulator [Candidatus Saccharibacteria bacterium]